MTTERRSKGILDYIGYITPIFLFVLTLYVNALSQNGAMVLAKVNDIDGKLFKHLTNDELHSPRSLTMSKAEFDMYSKFRDQQFVKIENNIIDIKELVKEHAKSDTK
jgi:hypothetical protein